MSTARPPGVVTIADLLAIPGLDLRVVAGAGNVDRAVSWAHVSELVDPTEFLRGGELLLITGVNLPAGPRAQHTYVTRLAEAGVVALGFGVGVAWEEIPEALVSSARQLDLPLLEVPRAVPFLAITRAVATEIARQEQAASERLAKAQRALTSAAVGGAGQASLLDELVRQTGGWGLLVNRAGAVLASAPWPPSAPEAVARRDALRADLARLRGTDGPASLVASSGDGQVWVQSLHAGRELLGFLAVGRADALGAVERQVVNAAVPLGILLLDRAGALGRDLWRLRTGAVRLLLAGQLDVVAEVAGGLWNGLPAGPLRAVLARGGRTPVVAARDRLANGRAVTSAQVVYGEVDEELICFCAAEGADLELVLRAVRGIDGLRVGVSEPAPLAELARATDEARQASAYGVGPTSISWFRELPRLGLVDLLPEPAATRFSQAVLRPLPAELLRSLRVWLAHHGQWDPAAAELRIHRHTLRNRVRKAERLLGRELGSPDLRAELWLALRLAERSGEK